MHKTKETLAFAGFLALVLKCLMAIGIILIGRGMLSCKTAFEMFIYLRPRIPGVLFFSVFFGIPLHMIWCGRRQPYVSQMLAAIAVVELIVEIPTWILYRLCG